MSNIFLFPLTVLFVLTKPVELNNNMWTTIGHFTLAGIYYVIRACIIYTRTYKSNDKNKMCTYVK